MRSDTQDETIGLATLRTSTATSMENEICASQECVVAISEGVLWCTRMSARTDASRFRVGDGLGRWGNRQTPPGEAKLALGDNSAIDRRNSFYECEILNKL